VETKKNRLSPEKKSRKDRKLKKENREKKRGVGGTRNRDAGLDSKTEN